MPVKNVAVVIPARYASSRFPGKPLVDIGGKTMIERVYRQAEQSKFAGSVIVATDDERIASAVKSFGGCFVMTRDDHATGTDRLAEVAALNSDIEIIVNVQGDEPLIDPSTIDAAINPLLQDGSVDMSTIAARIKDPAEITSQTVVKVVSDARGNAMYFSRSPIPFYRDAETDQRNYFAHMGLYVYRRDILLRLAALPPTALEKAEALEQLRALENGISIRVVEVQKRSPAVDRPEDLQAVLKALSERCESPLPAPGAFKPAAAAIGT